jgi:DNA-binding FadR family transcriptional regulator
MNANSLTRDGNATLVHLRAWLSQRDFEEATKLPSERVLCEELGVSRSDLRKALAILEKEGVIWRHVGKGTFIGAHPLDNMLSLTQIESATNPTEVMRARLLIEPMLAREAARNATRQDMTEIADLMNKASTADTWRQYEALDTAFHRAIAKASASTLLLAIFDTINIVRRSVVWGRLRDQPDRPPSGHHSFAEHEAIVEALSNRDISAAGDAMFTHLQTVAERLDLTMPR